MTSDQIERQRASMARSRSGRSKGMPAWVALAAIAVAIVLAVILAKAIQSAEPPRPDAIGAIQQEELRALKLERERKEFEEKARQATAEKSAYDVTAAKLKDLQKRFSDVFAIASASTRMTLATPVGQMQAISREVAALDVPPCMAIAKEKLGGAIDTTVTAFITFMRNEAGEKELPGLLFDRAGALMNEFKEQSGACDPNQPSATARP